MVVRIRDRRDSSDAFNKLWQESPERQIIYNRLKSHTIENTEWGKAKLVKSWFGCSYKVVELICKSGPADLRLRDSGFFGAGVYSTLQASYATMYAVGNIDENLNSPNEYGEYVVILCWTVVGNVYPITRLDYPYEAGYCVYYNQTTQGIALRPGFDAHLATVSPKSHYQAVNTEIIDWSTCADELVVKQESQILPCYLVYFK